MSIQLGQMICKPRKEDIFSMRGYYVWDGSIIKDNSSGYYYLFASKWEKRHSFYGWLTDSGIFVARGNSPIGPFTFLKDIPELKDQQWCVNMTHNPRVYFIRNKFYMFYIGTCWGNADPDKIRRGNAHYYLKDNVDLNIVRFNQRIGVASAESPEGPWKPCANNPVLSPKPDSWDAKMTANPSILELDGGKILLIYKSTRDAGEKILLGTAVSESPEGPFERTQNRPLFDENLEDPFLWRSVEGKYYMLCRKVDSKVFEGETVLYASNDACFWDLAGEKIAYDCNINWSDGTNELVDLVDRAFIYHENGGMVCISNSLKMKNDETGIMFRRINN